VGIGGIELIPGMPVIPGVTVTPEPKFTDGLAWGDEEGCEEGEVHAARTRAVAAVSAGTRHADARSEEFHLVSTPIDTAAGYSPQVD
jgi:hypothetical protein